MPALPRSIQAALDASEQLQASLAQPQQLGEPPAELPADTVPPQPAEPPTNAVPEPQPAPPAPRTADESVWEQRYRVLEGKYNAEVPRQAAELRELRAHLELVNARLQQPPQKEEPAAKKPLVTQQDIDAFGGDLVDLIGRKADEVAEQRVAQLQNHIAKLEQQLAGMGQRQESTDQDRFLTDVARQVPDYMEVNKRQDWLEWLTVKDPLTGATRQQYLDAASQARDAGRVAAIFNAFKSTLPKDNKPNVAKELERQVVPAKSASGTVPTPSQAATKIWTQKDINAFYTAWRKGDISADEAVRIESELNTAMAQGRIRA